MRTNIVIDDALIEEAMRATGVKTKREAGELDLKALVRLGRQAEARNRASSSGLVVSRR